MRRSRWNDYAAHPGCQCYGCEKREVGCHSTCDEYKAWKAESDKAGDERRAKEAANRDYWSVVATRNLGDGTYVYGRRKRRK